MIRVGVLRGGTSTGYDESLAGGAYILKNLPRDKYEAVDIFIDADGAWHLGGKPLSYDKLHGRVDVVWNALNGFYGADGKVEQALELLGIPYVGSGPLSSAITMHKKLSKDRLAELGIPTPRGVYVESWGEGEREETVASVAASIARDFSPPWLVEPVSRGSAKEPIRAKSRDGLTAVLLEMFDLSIPVLIEEEVLGKRASVIAVPGFRGQPVYTFLPKGIAGSRDKRASEALQKLARDAHSGLVLGPYSRIEFVIARNGKLYVAKVDTVPSLAPGSDLHEALAAVGATFAELSDHMLFSTLEGSRGFRP